MQVIIRTMLLESKLACVLEVLVFLSLKNL